MPMVATSLAPARVLAAILVAGVVIAVFTGQAVAGGEIAANGGTLQPGANGIVWLDSTQQSAAEAVVQAIELQASDLDVVSLWLLEAGEWRYFLPAFPQISTFPQVRPLTSMIAIMRPSQLTGTAAPATVRPLADILLDGINAIRREQRLPELIQAPELVRPAVQYAEVLAAAGFPAQPGDPHNLDGQPWDRAQRGGYTYRFVGEVLAYAPDDRPYAAARAILDSWMASTDHVAILLTASATDIGLGCADAEGPSSVCVGMLGTRK